MKSPLRLVAVAALTTAVALPTVAHIKKSEPLQSMRQSYFALIGMAFSPMGDMVKGKIDWDSARFARWASDLAAVSSYQVERGFQPGSEYGTTRAKLEIWDDMDEFEEHLEELRDAAAKLADVAAGGDTDAMKAQFKATADTCKSCHDEFKSKDYLY